MVVENQDAAHRIGCMCSKWTPHNYTDHNNMEEHMLYLKFDSLGSEVAANVTAGSS